MVAKKNRCRLVRTWLTIFLSCFAGWSGCGGPDAIGSQPLATARTPVHSVTTIADQYLAESLLYNPELSYFIPVGKRIHDQFTDNSLTALDNWQKKQDGWLTQLNAIDGKTLGPTQWILHGSMVEAIEADIGLRICRRELWNVNPIVGWQLFMPMVVSQQPIDDESSRQVALTRWGQFPGFVQREIENLRKGIAEGYSAPKRSVLLVIQQLDGLLDMPLEQSPYFVPATKTNDDSFKAQWRELTEQKLLVALEAYRTFLANEYLGQARSSVALTAIPRGRTCYDAHIRFSTTQKRDGQQIFELGQTMVAANQRVVTHLGQQLYGETDFAKIVKQALSSEANRFSDANQILAFAEHTADRAFQALPQWFARVPSTTATIKPWPDYLDNGTLTDRYEAPKSKGSEGTYRISLKNKAQKDKASLEITTIHELYPGHHLQVSIAQENQSNHPATALFGNDAYVEGWARYAEHLAEEMGLYQVEASKIVRRAWPARGMVVDPGVHLNGWTEEQAVAYMMASGVMDRQKAESLYDRIAILPGQLTSYDVGASVFFDLRKQAEKRLGDQFDIREFHRQLLENGSLPLWMLHQHIQRWLVKK
ncbi:MAG: DUF885 domain-containing protein [Proteobacteria bacterium]|nr:DUF885 domain-containing protein [Pseudomonadota bacterium]